MVFLFPAAEILKAATTAAGKSELGGPFEYFTNGEHPHLTPLPHLPPSTEEIMLSGACDWQKVTRLMHAAENVKQVCNHYGLDKLANRMNAIQSEWLDARLMHNPLNTAMNTFLRDHCGNDLYIAKFRGQIHQFANYVLKNEAFSTLPEEIRDKLASTIHGLERRVPFDLPYSGYLNEHPKLITNVATDNNLNGVFDIYLPHQMHYTLPGEAAN